MTSSGRKPGWGLPSSPVDLPCVQKWGMCLQLEEFEFAGQVKMIYKAEVGFIPLDCAIEASDIWIN